MCKHEGGRRSRVVVIVLKLRRMVHLHWFCLAVSLDLAFLFDRIKLKILDCLLADISYSFGQFIH